MKITEKIKQFFKRIYQKKLPSGNIDETIIPILYKGRYEERIAEIIKNVINRDKDIYRIFLEKYDAISIGDVESEYGSILKYESYGANDKKLNDVQLQNIITEWLDTTISSAYSNRFPNWPVWRIKDEYNGKGTSFIPIFGNISQEDEFYYNILNNTESDTTFFSYLCKTKDLKGLEMLIKSNNNMDFMNDYAEENVFKLLNWAVPFYTDHSYDKFFEKYYLLIYIATKYSMSKGLEYADSIAKSIDASNKEEQDKILKDMEFKYLYDDNNVQISNEKTIELVEEILSSFDTSGKLVACFKEKMQSGKFIMYKKEDKQLLNEKFNIYFEKDDAKERLASDSPYYDSEFDVSIIPIFNRLSDIPTIVHEFIHQYDYNHSKSGVKNKYSSEIASIYYEKLAINYLISHGFSQSSEVLNDFFDSRLRNDAVNNFSFLDSYVSIYTIKKQHGEITMENVCDDTTASVISRNSSKFKGVDTVKREFAKMYLYKYKTRTREINDKIIKLCSYSLGTLFAEKYCNNDAMKEKMFELIDSPSYSIEQLIDELVVKERDDRVQEEDTKEK
ncbi:MAG: hypothetical protein IJ690_06010 [Clostridia bacterium]|nr:hypothetical protein [Clostridia bacterium]